MDKLLEDVVTFQLSTIFPAEDGKIPEFSLRAACIGWKTGQDGYKNPFHNLTFFFLFYIYNKNFLSFG